MLCPECKKPRTEIHQTRWNGVFGPGGRTESFSVHIEGVDVEMNKVCDMPNGSLYQCPKCKTAIWANSGERHWPMKVDQ